MLIMEEPFAYRGCPSSTMHAHQLLVEAVLTQRRAGRLPHKGGHATVTEADQRLVARGRPPVIVDRIAATPPTRRAPWQRPADGTCAESDTVCVSPSDLMICAQPVSLSRSRHLETGGVFSRIRSDQPRYNSANDS